MKQAVFHVDVNSAFISWEAVRRVKMGEPDLRLIPSVVGGDPAKRTSIVCARSIPAKKYGINTAEPLSMAIRKCPDLVWVEPDFKLYTAYSKAFKEICRQYSPVVESFSIDEVFMDMSGMDKIYPDLVSTAYEIKNRIKEELGFTVNIGVANNKLCAKMASDFEKPDKVHTLFPEEIETKIWPLAVGELFMVGKASAKKLTNCGIRTIGDLANSDVLLIKHLLGDRMGQAAWESANGIDDSKVSDQYEEAKSYSTETTSETDIVDFLQIQKILLAQADVVASRIRKEGAKCGCIAVSYKDNNFIHKSHQCKLEMPTDITDEIYEVACKLFKELWNGYPLRLIGLSLSDIDRDSCEQLSFMIDEKNEKLKKLDCAIDSIREKYGNSSVKRASTIDVGVSRKYR